MNDNQEKMIEVYKKQLTSLQNRVNQVSKPYFLEELIEKNKKLDDEIDKIKTNIKKLNNEQKLNEIVISKQNKNEQEDKANMLLKRMNMDYNKIVRENEKLSKKIEENKIKESENENTIINSLKLDNVDEHNLNKSDESINHVSKIAKKSLKNSTTMKGSKSKDKAINKNKNDDELFNVYVIRIKK